MEPRQLWERNAVLAEAFCRSDENVRDVQGTLDDAQATRSRTLAALAVTVRNDGAVADLLGLTEREVRLARRTVGKEDARAVADELLAAPLPPLLTATATAGEEPYAAEGASEGTAYVPPPPQQAPPPPSAPPQVQPQVTAAGGAGGGEPVWSAAMDAVLVGGWQTGVDLQVLATEFGLDLPRLVSRAQQLSVQGRLGPHRAGYGQEETGGRHRRGAGAGTGATQADTYAIPAQQTASAWDATAAAAADPAAWGTGGHQGWGQGWGQVHGQGPAAQEYESGQAYAGETATATHDWDGILHEWGDTPAVREGAAAYQQAYQPM
ncbi:hypothetical protein [Streptomyces sp. NPDC054784]